jgi:hypothetical protein
MKSNSVVTFFVAALVLSACTTTSKTGPKGDTWVIQRASGPGAPVIMKTTPPTEFWLEPVSEGGKVIYYRVKSDPGKMTANWANVILFPRGNAPFPTWPASAKLQPWSPAQAADYETKIHGALHAEPPFTTPPTTNTQRFEGDVEVGGAKEAITLYIVTDAVTDGSKLLIVDLKDTRGGLSQDGSGSGNPR